MYGASFGTIVCVRGAIYARRSSVATLGVVCEIQQKERGLGLLRGLRGEVVVSQTTRR
jgi:hypothetical protein